MQNVVVAEITKSAGRTYLYHFTRSRNLAAMAHFDEIYSSCRIDPANAGERRTKPKVVDAGPYSYVLNAHLHIPEQMIEATTTIKEFRACLDRHVFLWPTLADCRKMMDTYERREPEESFAVLQLDAYPLLMEHYGKVKLSKYDSGSSPRYVSRCLYRKSPAMFLPIDQFKVRTNHTVPARPSEIREVLIEGEITRLSSYLHAVYADSPASVPALWQPLAKPYSELRQ